VISVNLVTTTVELYLNRLHQRARSHLSTSNVSEKQDRIQLTRDKKKVTKN
jgi:hypothetical protein